VCVCVRACERACVCTCLSVCLSVYACACVCTRTRFWGRVCIKFHLRISIVRGKVCAVR
jgi:hypothetical protein